MSVELEIVGEDERDKWDTLVESLPHSTIFHTWKWLKIAEKHAKNRLYPIIGLKGTTIIGIYPLFYLKNFLFRSVFSPPPWISIPYLGPLIVDYDKLKQDKKESIFTDFQRKVDDFIKYELKPHYTQITSSPDLQDVRPFKWTGYHVEPMHNYIMNLSKGEDYVWEQFKGNLRKEIGRAQKKNISIEEGSKEELEWILNDVARRYEEQGKVASTPKGYLLDLYNAFYPQNMKIFVAKYNGEHIGGSIKLYYKNRLLNWIGNVKANIGGAYPNDLLEWEAIKWACEHGLRYYELIGANTPRLCHYKSKYNPNLSLYFSMKKYSSFISRMTETAYSRILKPMYTKIKLKTK